MLEQGYYIFLLVVMILMMLMPNREENSTSEDKQFSYVENPHSLDAPIPLNTKKMAALLSWKKLPPLQGKGPFHQPCDEYERLSQQKNIYS